ncbi:MAG: hypothetical protein R3E97_15190 [Candidatus Eisenbacteria bacterium]
MYLRISYSAALVVPLLLVLLFAPVRPAHATTYLVRADGKETSRPSRRSTRPWMRTA